jgi:hypothetical protein
MALTSTTMQLTLDRFDLRPISSLQKQLAGQAQPQASSGAAVRFPSRRSPGFGAIAFAVIPI